MSKPPRRPRSLTAIAVFSGVALALAGLLLVGGWFLFPSNLSDEPDSGLGGWSTLIQLLVIVTIVPIAAPIIATIGWLLRRNRVQTRWPAPELAAPPIASLESRLSEIDHLLAVGQITADEHLAMRGRILDLQ